MTYFSLHWISFLNWCKYNEKYLIHFYVKFYLFHFSIHISPWCIFHKFLLIFWKIMEGVPIISVYFTLWCHCLLCSFLSCIILTYYPTYLRWMHRKTWFLLISASHCLFTLVFTSLLPFQIKKKKWKKQYECRCYHETGQLPKYGVYSA